MTRGHWQLLDSNSAWNWKCVIPEMEQDFTELNYGTDFEGCTKIKDGLHVAAMWVSLVFGYMSFSVRHSCQIFCLSICSGSLWTLRLSTFLAQFFIISYASVTACLWNSLASVAELSLRRSSPLYKGVTFALTYILYLKMRSFFLDCKHFVCYPVTFLKLSPLLFFSLRDCKGHIIRYRVISGLLGCHWLKWL